MMGNPILQINNAGYGPMPVAPESRYSRGDHVRLRRLKRLADFPETAIVLAAVPAGTPAEYVLAHLMGEPRPLMGTRPKRCTSYILVNEGDPKSYLLTDKEILKTAGPPIEIGSVQRSEDVGAGGE